MTQSAWAYWTHRLRLRALLKAFALGLALGISSASLLFLRAQCAAAARGISEDFKVILFLRDAPSEKDRAALEGRLRGVGGVESVAYVSPEQALSRLTRSDEDLVRRLALVGPSPLPAAFELRLGESGVENAPAVLSALDEIARPLGVVRYPSRELAALVETKFYAQTLRLVLEALGWIAAFVIAARLAALIPTEIYQSLFGLPGTSESHSAAIRRYLGAARGTLLLQIPTGVGALTGAILGAAASGAAFLPAAAILPAGDALGYGVAAGFLSLLGGLSAWALVDAPSL